MLRQLYFLRALHIWFATVFGLMSSNLAVSFCVAPKIICSTILRRCGDNVFPTRLAVDELVDDPIWEVFNGDVMVRFTPVSAANLNGLNLAGD